MSKLTAQILHTFIQHAEVYEKPTKYSRTEENPVIIYYKHQLTPKENAKNMVGEGFPTPEELDSVEESDIPISARQNHKKKNQKAFGAVNFPPKAFNSVILQTIIGICYLHNSRQYLIASANLFVAAIVAELPASRYLSSMLNSLVKSIPAGQPLNIRYSFGVSCLTP